MICTPYPLFAVGRSQMHHNAQSDASAAAADAADRTMAAAVRQSGTDSLVFAERNRVLAAGGEHEQYAGARPLPSNTVADIAANGDESDVLLCAPSTCDECDSVR